MTDRKNIKLATVDEQVRYCLNEYKRTINIYNAMSVSVHNLFDTLKHLTNPTPSSKSKTLNNPVVYLVPEANLLIDISMLIIASKLDVGVGFCELLDGYKFYVFYTGDEFHKSVQTVHDVAFKPITWIENNFLMADGIYCTLLNFIQHQKIDVGGVPEKIHAKGIAESLTISKQPDRPLHDKVRAIVDLPKHMPIFVYDNARTTLHRFKDSVASDMHNTQSRGYEYVCILTTGLFDSVESQELIKIAEENKLNLNWITLEGTRNFYIFHANEKYNELLRNHPDIAFKPLHWTMNNINHPPHTGPIYILDPDGRSMRVAPMKTDEKVSDIVEPTHMPDIPLSSEKKVVASLMIDPANNEVKITFPILDGNVIHPMAKTYRRLFDSAVSDYLLQLEANQGGDFTKKIVINIES